MIDSSSLLRIEQLSHRFGDKVAIDHVDWKLDQCGVVGLVGPNGAGKTTLFSLIAGFLRVQGGSIEVLGGAAPGSRSLVSRVAVMPQDAIFARDVSIVDQMLFLRALDGVTGTIARQEVVAALESVGLADQLDRGAAVLSHGMGKRLGVAQAILGSPELILLDEPTAGLDPANALQVRDLIRSLGKKALVIVSSHNLLELQDLIDEVAVIVAGRMVASGPIDEVTGSARRFELRLGRVISPGELQQIRDEELVRGVSQDGTQLTVDLDASADGGLDAALDQLLHRLLKLAAPPRQLREGASLEEAYLRLTGESEQEAAPLDDRTEDDRTEDDRTEDDRTEDDPDESDAPAAAKTSDDR
ncbi:MAG: ABC transporter ATP-binding protein [Planctomycetota bacterium]|nr:ABC transporter ATP-binding protein [Planctomycetota bacterium]